VRILFITSAHNSLSQRLQVELVDRGHAVAVHLATSDEAMGAAVDAHQPDVIVAPMLKKAIPAAIWQRHLCLIVHPGITGDRGPSSIDWAIERREPSWGVTILQAVAEMDAGPIWAAEEFPLPNGFATKSSLYRGAVTEAAVAGVLVALARYERGGFQPHALDYRRADVRGTLRPAMKQADRAVDWMRDSTARIVRRIRAADSSPGVLDTALAGEELFLYGAHEEDRLRGAPGELLAQREGAICIGTVDGAVWVSHLKAKSVGPYAGIKLPAAAVLGSRLAGVPERHIAPTDANDHRTFRDIVYSERNGVGYLAFDFYNGAMSTRQCRRLRDAFRRARARTTKVIVLLGGRHYFSNGIHLNTIEAAPDPAVESWANINAIDDLVLDVLETRSHLVVSALCGNAGAGGAMMALAADHVYAREGIILNPHYKGMGGLYGSEYWTYTLPRRVGARVALELTEGQMALGTRSARELGFVDEVFDREVGEFEAAVVRRAEALAHHGDLAAMLAAKWQRRRADERRKPLAAYRAEELARMSDTFFGPDPAYHEARQRFVFKGAVPAQRRHSDSLAALRAG
jgi:putative two-component system hydrogenase maturation factor HypX/HoxX